MSEFREFPKIHRLNRDVLVTEKIDGTNAAVGVEEDGTVYAQSRSQIITPKMDNFGFAAWVAAHEDELRDVLGPGLHYGEWWGAGIQRGYGLTEKRLSLFNVDRWVDVALPYGVDTVPVLYRGPFDQARFNGLVEELRLTGSRAAPGFMRPEGIVIYHTQGRFGLKVTLEKDELPKGYVEKLEKAA